MSVVYVLAFVVQTSGATTPGEMRPRFERMRQDEDWRALEKEEHRTEVLDTLKHIGLSADSYLSFGGNFRLAYELFVNEDYGRLPQDDSGSFLFRGLLHADIVLRSNFRTFVQLKTALETGRDGGPGPIDVNRLDLHQGFFELRFHPSRPENDPGILVRVGRQELSYGRGRLVDLRDGPNVRRSFDSVLLRHRSSRIAADALFGLEVPVGPGVFDDGAVVRPLLWGFHWETRPGWLSVFGLDVYYFGTKREGLVYVDGVGDEVRHIVGGRWWSKTPRLAHDLEVTAQFGGLADPAGGEELAIRAWGVAASASYALIPHGARPEVTIGGGATSGDRSPGDGVLETFRSPFPDLRFAGAATRLGPGNLWGVNAGFGVSPVGKLRLLASGRVFARTSPRDGVYSPAGFPQRVGSTDALFVGGGATLLGLWFVHEYATGYAMLEYFGPGAFVKAAPPAEQSLFFTLGITSQF